ncbi:hypothetical protein MMC14_004604 [Varicellaria rhodocarpa]|nr:hypothetical protein [Varicellaria rhodocarpa]
MAPSKSKLKKDGKETSVENRIKREVRGSTENEHKVTQPSSSKSPTVNKSPMVPSKRKAEASSSSPPSKAARRSSRTAPESHFEPLEILQLLLSPSSLSFCRPSDEVADLEARGSDLVTYSSSSFTPFEELACAVILSRPISHTLGLRSIRTLFNKPYELRSPRAMREAGAEGRRKALDQARTQHRQKTAEELGNLADVVVETIGDGDEDVNLERVRRDAGENVNKERELLKNSIKGLGKTGLDIFFRRIQGEWKEVYPFVDQKTLGALKKLGLPDDAEGLRNLLDENWKNLTIVDIAAEDDQGKRRKAFARILERAIGADLEKNIDKIKAEAGNSA